MRQNDNLMLKFFQWDKLLLKQFDLEKAAPVKRHFINKLPGCSPHLVLSFRRVHWYLNLCTPSQLGSKGELLAITEPILRWTQINWQGTSNSQASSLTIITSVVQAKLCSTGHNIYGSYYLNVHLSFMWNSFV